MNQWLLPNASLNMLLTLLPSATAQTTLPSDSRQDRLRSPQTTEQLIEFVQRAAAKVSKKGDDAFDDFRQRPGEWNHADTYLFVLDLASRKFLFHGTDPSQGNVLADPIYRALEGKNQLDLKSAGGKPVLRKLIQLIQTRDSGWSGPYLWPRPDGGPPAPRMTLVKKVTVGSQALDVASGYYVGRQVEP